MPGVDIGGAGRRLTVNKIARDRARQSINDTSGKLLLPSSTEQDAASSVTIDELKARSLSLPKRQDDSFLFGAPRPVEPVTLEAEPTASALADAVGTAAVSAGNAVSWLGALVNNPNASETSEPSTPDSPGGASFSLLTNFMSGITSTENVTENNTKPLELRPSSSAAQAKQSTTLQSLGQSFVDAVTPATNQTVQNTNLPVETPSLSVNPPPSSSAPTSSFALSDLLNSLAGTAVPNNAVEPRLLTEKEWLSSVQSKWAEQLQKQPRPRSTSKEPDMVSLSNTKQQIGEEEAKPLAQSSRMLYFVPPPPIERISASLALLQRQVLRMHASPDDLEEQSNDPFTVELGSPSRVKKTPLRGLLEQLEVAPEVQLKPHHRKKPKPKLEDKMVQVRLDKPKRVKDNLEKELARRAERAGVGLSSDDESESVNMPKQSMNQPPAKEPRSEEPVKPKVKRPEQKVIQGDDAAFVGLQDEILPLPQVFEIEEPLTPRSDTVPETVHVVHLNHERNSSVKAVTPPKVSPTVRHCQVCNDTCRSVDYPDLLCEQEGQEWCMCAECVFALFPSIDTPSSNTPATIKIGEKPDEWLWELSPRSCLPIKWRGLVWPTAYHAVAAELVGSMDIRQQIFSCFDAEEVDAILKAAKLDRKAVSNWAEIRDERVRAILQEKVKQHPLLQKLLLGLHHKRLIFSETGAIASAVWGENDFIGKVTMELADEAIESNTHY